MEDSKELYGIARCSTNKQDVQYAVNELMKRGVPKENIFIEYISGKVDLSKRTELNKLFKIVKPGISHIIATDITRIARNPKAFYEIMEFVENNKLCLEIGTLKADCRNEELDIMTSTMLQVLSIFANFDLKMKIFQIKLGLQNAIDKGTKLGRPQTTKDNISPDFYKYYALYKANKITRIECQRLSSIKQTTFYKYKKIIETK